MPLDEPSVPIRRSPTIYADVIVPRHIAKAFTYLVPPALVPALAIGQRVLVPFGKTTLEGAVISLSNHPPKGVKADHLKEISSLGARSAEGEASASLFELSRSIAEHYVAPWGQCLRLVFPHMPRRRELPARYRVTDAGRAALDSGSCPEPWRSTLERIAKRTSGLLSTTLRQARDRAGRQVVDALIMKSWIAVSEAKSRNVSPSIRFRKSIDEPSKLEIQPASIVTATQLPEPDSLWASHVAEGLRGNRSVTLVLHAPIEHRMSRLVYAVQQTYAMNKSAIILAGQAARAEWVGRVLSTFTKYPITFLHTASGYDRWKDQQADIPSIVVGTRSAIFTPLRSVGLIWVDGEEDPALKELQEPRYHARDVACMRAKNEHALVVLASAHPSLESMANGGAVRCTVPPDTVRQPQIECLDLRGEPGGTLLSRRLISAMQQAVQAKAGVILFLNRRGFAGALVCRDCSWVPRCSSCAVALPYYREAGRLGCRYCGMTVELPDACPSCRATRLSPVGEGTERVEVETRRLFPQARIARLDGDTLRHSSAARDLWEGARSGTWDVVIGTQALFQREPLPQSGLVGILHADSGLHVPDFRAAERTYHLLADAVSLARPASEGGRVLVQTKLPAHHAVQAVLSGQPNRFYEEELSARQQLGFPPASQLVALSVFGKDLRLVERSAKQWRNGLEQSVAGRGPVMILGPVPGMGGRRKGYHREQILVKSADRILLRRVVGESVDVMEREHRNDRLKFVVDVDPVEMG